MHDHIAKPIDPATLFETVARFYKRGAAPASANPHALATLDSSAGLSRVGGNEKLYAKLLRQFVEQQSTAVGQITAALASGDKALAERLAHTLKGVAGNIGATQVQFAAGVLEKSIRDGITGTELETATQQVTAALDPLVADLRVKFAAETPEVAAVEPTPSPVDPAQSRETAKKLNALLAEQDPTASDFIEANRAALRALFDGEGWPEFEKLVQGYAFADAQAQLEQALKGFAGSL
jgi:HPt (histidine-containing phosphotransfer) domain-containing protein